MPASPESLGIDAGRLDRACDLLDRAAADGVFPGAVALVARRGEVVADWAVGLLRSEPASERRPMRPDTIFDVASLTKPVAGATAALLLLEDGAWSLDDAVARFIPEFAANGKHAVTIRQVLSHSAGFEPWLPMYLNAQDPDEALRYVCSLSPTYRPGTEVQYSDIGFSVVSHLVRRIAGETLDTFLARRVWEPLGMSDTCFNPPAALRPRIAATECGNGYEEVMVQRLGATFDRWRPRDVIVGSVNDGNTYYALEGVSSHAGLFSTAADLLAFAQMYQGGGAYRGQRILSPATVAEATSNQTAGLPRSRGLGWDLPRKGRQPTEEWAPGEGARRVHGLPADAGPTPRSFGDLVSDRAFGHSGFTGCSLVVDPARDLVVVLLTNRIHPDAANSRITAFRPRFHNAVLASLVE